MDGRKIMDLKEGEAKNIITCYIITLCNDFEITKDKDQIRYIVKRVYNIIEYKFKQMQVQQLERAMIELTSNYPTYRTINVAVIMTAFYRTMQ